MFFGYYEGFRNDQGDHDERDGADRQGSGRATSPTWACR